MSDENARLRAKIIAETKGFDAFIDATNVVGDIEGYLRLLSRVEQMMMDDHGLGLSRAAELIEQRGIRQAMNDEIDRAFPCTDDDA